MEKAIESNRIFLDAWDVLNRDNPGFESKRDELVGISWSGFPAFFFNIAVSTAPPDSVGDFHAALEETLDWAAMRRLPWMFVLCHDLMGPLLPDIQDVLSQAGLAPVMPLTGMEATRLEPGRAKPEGVWLTESAAGIGDAVLRLNEAAYQMPIAEPGSLTMETDGWWRAPDRMITMLRTEDTAASCSAVFNVDGMRYVAFVATRPNTQRKGYAEATMRDVLERSRAAGLGERTYLHASAAGRPVYTRMGYTVTAEHTIYALGH
ncbi:MAG: GNAT family N-acetyltransferase [Acidobacteria bacterium]|nr:GNAT family N-acetyltransferase [Acidobacteriota bacterium]